MIEATSTRNTSKASAAATRPIPTIGDRLPALDDYRDSWLAASREFLAKQIRRHDAPRSGLPPLPPRPHRHRRRPRAGAQEILRRRCRWRTARPFPAAGRRSIVCIACERRQSWTPWSRRLPRSCCHWTSDHERRTFSTAINPATGEQLEPGVREASDADVERGRRRCGSAFDETLDLPPRWQAGSARRDRRPASWTSAMRCSSAAKPRPRCRARD